MEILRQESDTQHPCPRGYVASICIRVFKGRKDVVAHLFRPSWDPAEEAAYPWDCLVQETPKTDPMGRGDSREVLLESFTKDELDQIVSYISARYADRLTRIDTNAMRFPLPTGLLPLRSMPEGKDMGRIRFEIVPGYPLPFTVHGLYDLSQHKPMNQGVSED